MLASLGMTHALCASLSSSGLSSGWDKSGGSPLGAERSGTVSLEPGEGSCSPEDIGGKLIRCWALESESRCAVVLGGCVCV